MQEGVILIDGYSDVQIVTCSTRLFVECLARGARALILGSILGDFELVMYWTSYELGPPALEDTFATWRGVTHVPPR